MPRWPRIQAGSSSVVDQRHRLLLLGMGAEVVVSRVDHAGELAEIAGPIVSLKNRQGLGREAAASRAVGAGWPVPGRDWASSSRSCRRSCRGRVGITRTLKR